MSPKTILNPYQSKLQLINPTGGGGGVQTPWASNIDGAGFDLTDVGKIDYNEADWTGGNVTYVPATGNIQDYIDAAAGGDVLILAAGAYSLPPQLDLNKNVSLMGQGVRSTYIPPLVITNSDVGVSNLTVISYHGGTVVDIHPPGTDDVITNINFFNVFIAGFNFSDSVDVYGLKAVDADCNYFGGQIQIIALDSYATGVYIEITDNAISTSGSIVFQNTAIGAALIGYGLGVSGGRGLEQVDSRTDTVQSQGTNFYFCSIQGAIVAPDFSVFTPDSGVYIHGGTQTSALITQTFVGGSTIVSDGAALTGLVDSFSDVTTTEASSISGSMLTISGDVTSNNTSTILLVNSIVGGNIVQNDTSSVSVENTNVEGTFASPNVVAGSTLYNDNLYLAGSATILGTVGASNLSGTNTGDNAINTSSMSKFLTGVTLTAATWALSGGTYQYAYPNSTILSTSLVDVIPANTSVGIVQAAQLLPYVDVTTSQAILYANYLPTGDMTMNFVVQI
jgi:hypothetical protein